MKLLRSLGLGLLLVLPPCATAEPEPVSTSPPPAAGVVVERLTPRGAGAMAGLLPGDVILSWSAPAALPALPEPARGDVRSPYDLLPPAIEQAPRRAVTLHGKRGAEDKAWVLAPAEWRMETRPGLPEDLAALDLAGRTGAEAGDLAAAGRSWRSAAQAARDGGDGRLAAWFLDRLARALAKDGKGAESDAAFEEAVALLERQPDLLAAADLQREWAKATVLRGDRDLAVARFGSSPPCGESPTSPPPASWSASTATCATARPRTRLCGRRSSTRCRMKRSATPSIGRPSSSRGTGGSVLGRSAPPGWERPVRLSTSVPPKSSQPTAPAPIFSEKLAADGSGSRLFRKVRSRRLRLPSFPKSSQPAAPAPVFFKKFVADGSGSHLFRKGSQPTAPALVFCKKMAAASAGSLPL